MRRHALSPSRFAAAVALAAGLASVLPATAVADTGQSTNWAGYASHRHGVHFNRVIGAWRQPTVSCVPGNRTYSAIWVGIGGFSESSTALEQIGTEADCTASGAVASSAWYELVPAPSQDISLRVRPGDAMLAEVSVDGHRVTLTLNDVTRHRSYKRTFRAARVDTSSAEWIVEAPSDCVSSSSCQTLPLADFGSASFALASARSSTGRVGAITSRTWGTTKIALTPGAGSGGHGFVVYRNSGPAAGTATPSALSGAGSGFSVAFGTIPLSGQRFMATQATLQPIRLVHPLR